MTSTPRSSAVARYPGVSAACSAWTSTVSSARSPGAIERQREPGARVQASPRRRRTRIGRAADSRRRRRAIGSLRPTGRPTVRWCRWAGGRRSRQPHRRGAQSGRRPHSRRKAAAGRHHSSVRTVTCRGRRCEPPRHFPTATAANTVVAATVARTRSRCLPTVDGGRLTASRSRRRATPNPENRLVASSAISHG